MECLLVDPVGMEYRKLGVAASRVRAVAGPGEGWGWRRAGKGSEPGEVQPGDLLPAGGPRSLGEGDLAGGGGDGSEYVSAGGGAA